MGKKVVAELVARAGAQGVSLTGEGELLTPADQDRAGVLADVDVDAIEYVPVKHPKLAASLQ